MICRPLTGMHNAEASSRFGAHGRHRTGGGRVWWPEGRRCRNIGSRKGTETLGSIVLCGKMSMTNIFSFREDV